MTNRHMYRDRRGEHGDLCYHYHAVTGERVYAQHCPPEDTMTQPTTHPDDPAALARELAESITRIVQDHALSETVMTGRQAFDLMAAHNIAHLLHRALTEEPAG